MIFSLYVAIIKNMALKKSGRANEFPKYENMLDVNCSLKLSGV